VLRETSGKKSDLGSQKRAEFRTVKVHDIETIAATCGLIHDLGNPPFGHSGESAIQSWFKSKLTNPDGDGEPIFEGIEKADTGGNYQSQNANDFLNWEGNAQTLRLLSKLQVLADDFGINLTCGTFSAACKYSARSNELNEKEHERSKTGFFASEAEIVESVAKETGTVGIRNPITYLVEASDDIVYATGDLEDGIRKGLMDWSFLREEILQISKNDQLVKRIIEKAENKVKFSDSERPKRNEEVAQAFRTFSIGAMKDAVSPLFTKRLEDIENGSYHEELVKDKEYDASAFVDACKKIGQRYVYPSSSTIRLELMGRKVIHDLMDILWEGARLCGSKEEPKECRRGFAGKAFSLISDNYRKVFKAALEEKKLPERYYRLQLVTDQIAGMTDHFAITTHKRLMNG
jgi:dGTPase